jgi:putative endonuclease
MGVFHPQTTTAAGSHDQIAGSLAVATSVRYGRWMAERPTRAEIGKLGEQIAASFLTQRGFLIEVMNMTNRGGEIDIIASGPDGRIAFEVKTSTDGVDPTEAVDRRKLDALERTMAHLHDPAQRLDVIAVRLTTRGAEIRWLRDVS